MNTLPLEIITMIFDELYNDCTYTDVERRGYFPGKMSSRALASLHTCRTWRQIGLEILGLEIWRVNRKYYFQKAMRDSGFWRRMVLGNLKKFKA